VISRAPSSYDPYKNTQKLPNISSRLGKITSLNDSTTQTGGGEYKLTLDDIPEKSRNMFVRKNQSNKSIPAISRGMSQTPALKHIKRDPSENSIDSH
jgi:hypothetical protein